MTKKGGAILYLSILLMYGLIFIGIMSPFTALADDTTDLLYSMYSGFDTLAFTDTSKIGQVLTMARSDLGLNYLKVHIRWDQIETSQGVYSWTQMDQVAAYAQANNLSIIPFFTQDAPNWAWQNRQQNLPDSISATFCNQIGGATHITNSASYFADYIYQFVSRYKTSMNIKYIELENEPNGPCLWPDTAQYLAQVDNAAYEKVKSIDPNIRVCSASFHQPLGIGMSLSADNSYSGNFLKGTLTYNGVSYQGYLNYLNKGFDCFSLHDYGRLGFTETDTNTADTYSTQYDLESKYRTILDQYGFNNTEIIFTECAYDRKFFNNDESYAAADMVQGYLLSHAKGIAKGRFCQSVSTGPLKYVNGIIGGQINSQYADYGITDITVSPTVYYAGYYAFQTLRNKMLTYPTHVVHVTGLTNDNGYWVEEFADASGNKLYAAFVPIRFSGTPSTTLPASQTATINIGAAQAATITTMKGTQSSMTADVSGNISLSVSDEPEYIEVKGSPAASVSPASKDFGSVNPGSSSSAQTFTVTNTGTNNLYISAVSRTGTDPDQFSIQSDGCSGKTIAPSGTCDIQVIFSPASEGSKSAALSISSNDPDTANLNLTLSGTGVSAANGTGVSPDILEINFHHLATNSTHDNILKLFNPVIDDTNRRLYVVGSKTTYVGVIDLNTDKLVETFDIGVKGGFLIFNSDTLYSYDFAVGKCYQVDTAQKNAVEISETICEAIIPHDKGQPKYWGSYSFKETGYQSFADGSSGFTTDWRQDLNGAYGVIEIYDASNIKRGEIIHGPDALYFIIDQATGKLYTTNTGDGSITIFDLNKLASTNYCQDNACKIGEIDVGNSAEQVIVDSSGNIYLRNRLGGSVIYKYNQNSNSMSIINNENHVAGGISMWPTGIGLSSDERKLFSLSHYGALIDVIDTATNQVTAKIQFVTDLKPRTDSISTMEIDRSRNRLYVAWPELGIIGVADGNSNTVLGTIDLTQYGFDRSKAANAGPGLITLEVSEKDNRLYAYLKHEQKTLIFNGDSLVEESETTIGKIKVNDDKNVLYVDAKILDPVTYIELGSFSKGQEVIAFNNNSNAVYLYEMQSSGFQGQEKVYEFVNNVFTKEWILDPIKSGVKSSTYFDFPNNTFYVAYFETGIVKKYSLASSGESTSDFSLVTISPSSIQSGSSGATTVSVTRMNGHTAAITLSVATNAQGITGSGSIGSGADSGTLTIVVPLGLTAGTYALTLNGSDGSLSRSIDFNLAVTEISSTDSAFGVYMSHTLPQHFMQAEGMTDQDMFAWCDKHMSTLGAHWTRYSLLAAWSLIEPTLGGGYNWSADEPNGRPDTILGAVYASGNDINAVINIQSLSLGTGTPTRSPFTNPTEYTAFVKALAARYDGDGVNDAPGSIKVNYFQLANEVQDWFDRGMTADQYGEAAKTTLDALRSANPNAQLVMLGGFAENTGGVLEDRYKQAIQAMKSRGVKPVAIDIHWWYWTTASSDWQSPVILDARAYLDSIGWQDVQIWSMEDGAWTGCPANLTALTEEDQALTLVKRYVWGRANGLAKIFWQELIDGYNFSGQADSPFNSMGLIDDGEQNCSDITRRNTERIAYWSYKKLAETTDNLVATPSGTVSGTHDGTSVFAYKYTRRSDSTDIYIVWREGSTGNVTISVPGSNYHITDLIPDRYGNYAESDLAASSGSITVSVGSQPLLIVPSSAPSDTSAPTTTASPAGGTYSSSQNVTLSCDDGTGSGCAASYYCTGSGCTPATTYIGAITIASSTVLRFNSIDNAGNSESIKTETYVINHPPVSNAGGPYSVGLGSGISFDGSGSSDSDIGDSVSYSWDIASGTYTLTGMSPSLTSAQIISLGVGAYPVNLTVTDSFGAANSASATLTINMTTFYITTSAGSNGSIVCTPNPVNYSSSSTCVITPDSGYHIDSVTVDGAQQNATSPYIFSNVTSTHNISATFALNSVPPSAPTGLNLSNMKACGPTITWGTVGGAATYKVYRSQDNSTWGLLGSVSHPSNSYGDMTAQSNTSYYWTVTAQNTYGESAKPQGVSARTALLKGWNMVSAPVSTSGQKATAVFGSWATYSYAWAPAGNTDPDNDGSWQADPGILPGQSIIVWATNDTTVISASGSDNPSSVTVTLKPGWNLIGNHKQADLSGINSKWTIDGVPLSTAIVEGRVGGDIYWWDGSTYQSMNITLDDPPVEPWKGYWILNMDSVDHTLTIQ